MTEITQIRSGKYSDAELLKLGGQAMALADFDVAEACYRALAGGAKAEGAMIERYMECLYAQYKIDTARNYLGRRIKKNRKAHWLKVWRARFHVLAGDLEKARDDLQSLLKENPGFTALHQNLGHVYRAFGRLEKAAEHYTTAFAGNPDLGDSYRLAIECTQRDRLTATDERILAELETGRRSHPDLYFGLASIFDRLGDVDRAWPLYEAGNRLVHERWPKHTQERISSGRELAAMASEYLQADPAWQGPHQDRAVLLSGFPRSGTTMLESVIASGKGFCGCGELGSGGHAATRLRARLKSGAGGGRLDHALVSSFAQDYLASQRRMVRANEIGIDKATDQFRHSILLLSACPHARMVQIRRDPRDLILSNFKARFTSEAMAFAFSIPDLIAYLGLAMALMKQWQTLLPERVYTLSYDDYVHDTATGNTQLARFLDFDGVRPAFSFSRKRQAVITATSTQLGDRVRTDSSGKAEAYARYLQPWQKEIEALDELL